MPIIGFEVPCLAYWSEFYFAYSWLCLFCVSMSAQHGIISGTFFWSVSSDDPVLTEDSPEKKIKERERTAKWEKMFKEWNKNYIGDHPAVCNSTAGFVYLTTSLYQGIFSHPLLPKFRWCYPQKRGQLQIWKFQNLQILTSRWST